MSHIREVLDNILEHTRGEGSLRVWSVIITVFGDSIVPRGGVVALSSIRPLFESLGMEQNAIRTAMSRLARDGWVKRTRTGRQSYYALAEEGYTLFETAGRRIYSNGSSLWEGGFEMLLFPNEDHKSRTVSQRRMQRSGFGMLMQDVYLRPKSSAGPAISEKGNSIVVDAESISPMPVLELVRQCWPVDELSEGYRGIISQFDELRLAVKNNSSLPPLEALAFRTLLIHEWRRLVLRDVNLPSQHKPHGKDEDKARKLVAELYEQLLGPSETFLDGCLASQDEPLPRGGPQLKNRFRA